MTTTNSTTQPPHQDRGEECDICHGSGEGGGVDGDCAQCHGIGFNYHPTNSYERVRYARVIVDHVANGELGVDALHRVHDLLTAALTEAKQPGPGETVIAGYDPGEDDRGAEDYHVIMTMGRLLAAIAVILKGPEPAGTAWSYHDLPGMVNRLKAERDSAPSLEQALTQQRGECEDARKFRRLAQLLDGFDFRLGRNALMPPATYLDSVEITCEFQPGVGQSVIDAIMDILTGADPT